MRKVLALLALPALLGAMLFAGGAAAGGGGVARHQIQSAVLTISLEPEFPGNIHVYDITINPCDGSFTGEDNPANINGIDEAISGTLSDGNISFTSQYAQPAGITFPYIWTGSGPLSGFTGGDNYLPVNFVFNTLSGSVTNVTNLTNYKNHGDFVSSSADKNDAARSCIGMPVNSNK